MRKTSHVAAEAQTCTSTSAGLSEAPILFCPGALHGSIQQHVQDAPPPPVPRGHFLLPLPFSPDQIACRGIRQHQHHFAATSSSSRGILCVDSVESRRWREMGYSKPIRHLLSAAGLRRPPIIFRLESLSAPMYCITSLQRRYLSTRFWHRLIEVGGIRRLVYCGLPKHHCHFSTLFLYAVVRLIPQSCTQPSVFL